MEATYAVQWREPDGRIRLGRLELGPEALLFEGRENGGPAARRSLAYEELTSVRVDRWRESGRNGQPALVLEQPAGPVVVTSAVVHAGVVQELVDRLAGLALGGERACARA